MRRHRRGRFPRCGVLGAQMSLLIYGIVEAGGIDSRAIELAGRPLRTVVEGQLVAVVREHGGARLEPTAAALGDFERTVRALIDRAPILPAQFGSLLEDEAGVRGFLRRRSEDLLSRLKRVWEAVEIGLRASWREGSVPSTDGSESAASYLRDRLELREHARRVAHQLDPLTALALSSRRVLAPRPDLPVLDAYLVDRGRVDEFVALVEKLGGVLDDVDLVCTGPWPPYSFA